MTTADYHQLGLEMARLQKKDEALGNLEQAIRSDPSNLRYGNDYRMAAIRFAEYDRSIKFFEELVAQDPNRVELWVNLGFAYIDKMPSVGMVRQGLLSNRSIAAFNKAIEKDANSWIAFYGRGMNHLHWPKLFGRAKYAVEDFKKCLEIQAADKTTRGYHVLAYIALGDSYARNDQVSEAVKTWKQGLGKFPNDGELQARLSQSEETIKDFVEKARDMSKRIDTNLQGLWEP